MALATALAVVGRIGSASVGPIFPAMPFWFSRRPRKNEDIVHARQDRQAAEEAARTTLDRFLAETAPGSTRDVGVRGPTLTRLEACIAGIVAAAANDPSLRSWMRKLEVARSALARAISRERTIGTGGAA